MKTILAICITLAAIVAANAQTTVFTYQGKLNDNSFPANGNYEFQFRIYRAAVGGGTQIGGITQTVNAAVVNGIFTVPLDFGATTFSGEDRFLEISVRRNSTEEFVTLSPRQAITSSPYAIRSKTAETALLAQDALRLGGVDAAQYVQTNDARMTDDRNPLGGSPNYIQNGTTLQSLSNFNISGEGKAGMFTSARQYNIGANRILSNFGTANIFIGEGTGITGNNNAFVGTNSGQSNTTGFKNSYFGANTGKAATTSQFGSFFGNEAGFSNNADNNSFFGASAGRTNTTGTDNTFLGYVTGYSTTSGNENTMAGSRAGQNNTSGSSNSFFGAYAGFQNTNVCCNSYFGHSAGRNTDTGGGNAMFGYSAGFDNTSGGGNAFFGDSSGLHNTTGIQNTFIGRAAGFNNLTGSDNIAIGYTAGFGSPNLTNATAIGSGAVVSQSNSLVLGNNANVGIGTSTPTSKLTVVGLIETTAGGVKFPDGTIQTTASAAGGDFINNSTTLQNSSNFNISGTGIANSFSAATQYDIGANRILSNFGTRNLFVGMNAGDSNSGTSNTFVGDSAGSNNTSGSDNTFFGTRAGENNRTVCCNSFFGSFAGNSTSTGGDNAMFGYFAGTDNTSGAGNAFFGDRAGASNSIGNQNTFVGLSAGFNNLGGSNNIFIGKSSGDTNTSGNNNTVIGSSADVGSAGLSFATAIGANAVVSTSNTIALGRADGSDKVRIPGLGSAGSTQLCRNALNEISTCSSSRRYKTNINDFHSGLNIIGRLRPVTFNWTADNKPDLGLVAEEVAEADENLVIRNEKGEVEGVKYDRVGVVLVNAIKEQQQQIGATEKQNQQLKGQLEMQQKQLDEQKKEIELLKQFVCSQIPAAGVCKENNDDNK